MPFSFASSRDFSCANTVERSTVLQAHIVFASIPIEPAGIASAQNTAALRLEIVEEQRELATIADESSTFDMQPFGEPCIGCGWKALCANDVAHDI